MLRILFRVQAWHHRKERTSGKWVGAGPEGWAGVTQKKFKHEVPKEPVVALPWINLTFRHNEHQETLTAELAWISDQHVPQP
jgi:hypothetical protein